MMKFSLAVSVLTMLSACAHDWTPAERAAQKARLSDPCLYKQSFGGKCKTIWTAESGEAPPDLLVRPAR